MVLKSEKGSALLMVVLIGLLATTLGLVLFQVSKADADQETKNEDQVQAQYYAKAGVDIALGLIEDGLNPTNGQEFYGNIGGTFSSTELNNYSIGIRFELPGNNKIQIITWGVVRRGQQQAVSVQSPLLKYLVTNPNSGGSGTGGGSGSAPTLGKIFAAGVDKNGTALELTGSSAISGNTAVNSITSKSVKLEWSTAINNGDLYIGPGGNWKTIINFARGTTAGPTGNIPNGTIKNLAAVQSYPLPIFPTVKPTYSPIQTMDAGYWPIPSGGFQISQSGQYSSINVTNLLTINIGNNDVIIRTGTLSVTGNGQIELKRTGTGRLILYVDNSFVLSGSSTVNNANGFSVNSLIMYYDGSVPIAVGGSTKFNGSVYAHTANVTIDGSGGIIGDIVTGGSTVNVTGDASANVRNLYAPNASLNITGSSAVKGTVVANDIHVTGNSHIYYDDSMSMNFFNQLNWGSGSGSTTVSGQYVQ